MNGARTKKIFNFWFGRFLPERHWFPNNKRSPKEILSRLLVQPIKRHTSRFYVHNFLKNTKIIGITGSAGKTTTKEVIASVLSQKLRVKYSPKNIDPVYNIPDTCLKSSLKTQVIVLEMGIEYPGEMDYYLWLVRPDIGVLTNVYWTHTQFLKDIKNVLFEKSKLILSLPKDGWAILNFDDPLVKNLAAKTKAKVISIGKSKDCDFVFEKARYTKDFKTEYFISHKNKTIKIKSHLLGKQFNTAVLCAFAIGKIFGLTDKEIKKGIQKTKPQPQRMFPFVLKKNLVILDDTYNANPLATKESIEVLAKLGEKRRKIFLFGQMNELGKYEKEGHEEVGKKIAECKIDIVASLGKPTKYTLIEAKRGGLKKENLIFTPTYDEMIKKIVKILKPNDIVLVKGSRSLQMEKIVESLVKNYT